MINYLCITPRYPSHVLPVCPSHRQVRLGQSALHRGHQYDEMAPSQLHGVLFHRQHSLDSGVGAHHERATGRRLPHSI